MSELIAKTRAVAAAAGELAAWSNDVAIDARRGVVADRNVHEEDVFRAGVEVALDLFGTLAQRVGELQDVLKVTPDPLASLDSERLIAAGLNTDELALLLDLVDDALSSPARPEPKPDEIALAALILRAAVRAGAIAPGSVPQ